MSGRSRVPEVDYLATSVRPPFAALPDAVRDAVGAVAGSPVVAAAPPVGSGFGGAFAGLLDLEDGRRVFAKAAGESTPHVLMALAREREILPRLASLRCPSRRVGTRDVEADGAWRVLVLEAIDGTQPGGPWTAADADAAHDACLEIASAPLELLDGVTLASAADDLAESPAVAVLLALASGERRWPAGHLVPSRPVLDDLVGLAEAGPEAVRGDALQHLDLRPDNLLREPDGRMRVVDWNQAVVGAPWVDLVCLWPLMHHHGVDLGRFASSPLLSGVDDDTVDALLGWFVGFMLENADAPPPPGCTPALRAHTVFFSDLCVRLLADRRGWDVATWD